MAAHIWRMMIPRLRFALFLCALFAVLALGIAMGSERYLEMIPCPLCLLERWPYRVVMVAAAIGLIAPRPFGWLALAVCILAFTADAAIAFVHVGVEQRWWDSPLPQCNAPDFSHMTPAERFTAMPARPSKPCEDPTYLLSFLPVSIAMMNMIFAGALTIGFTVFAFRNARSPV